MLLTGTTAAKGRYRLTVPVYAGYTYEIYANPTLTGLGSQTLPFAVSETGAIDRNKHTATGDGTADFYVARKALRDFYYVAFRVPGANTGTP